MGGIMRDDEEAFLAFARTRSAALRRTAFLLCGDWHHAEDIVQISLAKLYAAWRKVQRRDAVDAYARRIVVRVFLDERRRGWVREVPTPDLPESRVTHERTEDRLVLLAALD